MTDEPIASDFLRQLVADVERPKTFSSFYAAPKSSDELNAPYGLLDALGLQQGDLSNTAAAALAAIEEVAKDSPADWLDFRWKLSAFVHLQDIFDARLQEGKELRTLFQQYYFYYESHIILAESVLAGLNGLYIASDALLRPFLEFSLLQNYYYRFTREVGSYAPVEKFFADKRTPSWGTALKKALPKDAFCRPIRYRISAHLSALSDNSQHAYHPQASPLQHRQRQHGHSVEGIFFWLKTRLILDAALWLYYVNFPLLFHPVDVVRKFGFKGPVGELADPLTGHVVQRSLSEANYRSFKDYSTKEAQAHLEWVRSQRNLTDAEIAATWNEEHGRCPPDLRMAFGMHMARFRALRIGLAFHAAERLQDVPDEFLDRVWSLRAWSALARRGRHGTKS